MKMKYQWIMTMARWTMTMEMDNRHTDTDMHRTVAAAAACSLHAASILSSLSLPRFPLPVVMCHVTCYIVYKAARNLTQTASSARTHVHTPPGGREREGGGVTRRAAAETKTHAAVEAALCLDFSCPSHLLMTSGSLVPQLVFGS
jgi:hypothetical protein